MPRISHDYAGAITRAAETPAPVATCALFRPIARNKLRGLSIDSSVGLFAVATLAYEQP